MKKILYAAAPFISVVVIVLIWAIASAAIGIEFLLPSPAAVWAELIKAASSARLYQSLLTTFLDTLKAFAIAFVFACALSLAAASSTFVEKLLRPFIVLVQSMPTMSIIFLAIIWLTSAQSPVLVGFLVVFPLLYSSFLAAIKGVDKQLAEMSKLYNVRRRDVVLKLYVPQIADKAYADCVSALALGVKLAVAGEALAQTGSSLGFLLQSSKSNLETGALLAYTVAAVLLGYVMQLIPTAVRAIVVYSGRKARRKKAEKYQEQRNSPAVE